MKKNSYPYFCKLLVFIPIGSVLYASSVHAEIFNKNRITLSQSHIKSKKSSLPKKKKSSITANSSENVSVTVSRFASHGADNVISKAIMAQFTPGINPLKVADRLPGVSFSSTDPLGIDTWGTSIYVRGFFMDQLGVTLDGIPLEEQIYQSVMGVNIIQAAISDDISRTTVSEGPGGVNVPSTSTLGGTLQFETSDPANKVGAKVSQGFGSYGSFRTYVRGDTGKLNASGTKAMVAYSRSDEKLWVGGGDQFQQQVDAKIVQPIGQNSNVKVFFNWSQLAEWGYQDQSLSILNGLGWRVSHLYPNYTQAYEYGLGNTSLPTTPAIEANGQSPYLYDGGQAEVDYTGGLNFDIALNDRLHWLSVVYGQSDTGHYTYSDYGTPSADTEAPFSEEVWQTRQERYGAVSSLRYEADHHTIDTGVWFENNDQQSGLFWYNEPTLGQGAPLKTVGPYTTYGAAFKQGYGFQWHTNNFTYHLEDTWHPLHNLRVVAGFKSMVATTVGGAQYNNPDFTGADNLAVGGLTASSAFLPHVGANWHFLPEHELYFDVAENMRSYQVQPYGGVGASPWSVQDQTTFLQLRKTIKPEKDWVYAVGYRYNGKYAQGSLAGYHADANNRLQAATAGTITNPVSTVVSSTVHINGVDAALTLTPIKGLALYNSVSYNHATYGSNFALENSGMTTQGKRLVNYPEFMYKANLSYTWKGLETHFDVHYYSKRYFSYTNDTSVPGYWLASTGARWNVGKVGFIKNLMFDFNIYNLMNSKYISMMGENGNPMSGDYQSLERGSIRQYFGTVSAQF
ncbi:TonB-dependent receptor [Neokomagataea thailandica NBRC 106555]|uniref:TonB-dependent receptor n=2 Tax=Neokomagataea TaxID=1223423 RepID=A0A4Y6V5U3_9PROT|nr:MULTISPECIES: TonB-dependent receptor [Neokomagataea]QDH25502.1 TonB-dependent receptor [Neokomagataea tanensis]GBR52170.1 TonB-dependent receptor [Neokomagataea thailandica NBRC 106555]